jgi:intracellular septation protein
MFSRRLILNILCEFGPIVAFLVAYTAGGFESGTVAMITAVIAALITLRITEGHFPLFAVFSTLTVLIFGSVSILIHVPSIFILRDTVFDSCFAILLFVSVVRGTPLLKFFFKNVFAITDHGWRVLTLRWAWFFLFLALVNEWVRWNLSPEEWVTVKVYMIVATNIFGFYQFTLARRERLPDASPWGLVR